MAIAILDTLKASIFSTAMPDMPPKLREIWQAAFMLRRKYSNPVDTDPEAFFHAAWSDASVIIQSYGENETVNALILEVYFDIERQYEAYKAKKELAEQCD